MNQEILLFAIAGIVGFLFGAFVIYLILRSSRVKRANFDGLKSEFVSVSSDLDTKVALEGELRKSNIELQKIINSKDEKILQLTSELSKTEERNSSFEESRKKSLAEFENIANKLFSEKTERFSKQSRENIEQLLNPLRENLKDFKKKVEETYDRESKERFSLETKIKDLVELNQQISKDATNLANALKIKPKAQGNWGEMILESVLQYSGLVKNVQYFTQESQEDEFGNRKQPDVKVKYPDDRYVIIDSKVSLTAYERFASCDDAEEQKIHLNNHIKSIKNHINGLSSKEYERFDKALDFVLLFIPIEPAFLIALQYDNQLWSYAYSKRIVLMSPTNLIPTLKVIEDVWNKENQNNNAREIAKRGERLYDKFVSFVGDMKGIGGYLGKVGEKYDDAMKKLSMGSGNLIGQAEKLKKLGINSKKELPEEFLTDNPELDTDDENLKKAVTTTPIKAEGTNEVEQKA